MVLFKVYADIISFASKYIHPPNKSIPLHVVYLISIFCSDRKQIKESHIAIK
jgi:hypothetical protein